MIFHNYEFVKLQVHNPDLVNSVVLGAGLFAAFISIKPKQNISVLDTSHTDQLKGCAILLIIIGHLWNHVALEQPGLTLAGFGVALFLFLSGYGLSVSADKHHLSFIQYAKKRISRIFFPYWLATTLILVLDYFILGRLLSWEDLTATLLGVNVTTATSHLDYSRWFITLILLWYILHYWVVTLFPRGRREIVLIFCALGLFLLDYFFDYGWYQLFSFPTGCLLARYRKEFKIYGVHCPKTFGATALVVCSAVLFCQAVYGRSDFTNIPDIIFLLVREIGSILFCISLLTLFATSTMFGKYSAFLGGVGSISYELFLLHGPLLIKYNPVITSGDSVYLSLQIGVFLVVLFALSFGFKRITP